MPTKRINVSVPADLYDAVEVARRYESRSSFVKRALAAALDGDGDRPVCVDASPSETTGSLPAAPSLHPAPRRAPERALESVLSEAKGPLAREQAAPGPVDPPEGSARAAAPTRAPVGARASSLTRPSDDAAMARQQRLNAQRAKGSR